MRKRTFIKIKLRCITRFAFMPCTGIIDVSNVSTYLYNVFRDIKTNKPRSLNRVLYLITLETNRIVMGEIIFIMKIVIK